MADQLEQDRVQLEQKAAAQASAAQEIEDWSRHQSEMAQAQDDATAARRARAEALAAQRRPRSS